MKKLDGRRLDHKTCEKIRMRVVQQLEAGESPEVVAQSLGFHRSCVYEWSAKYREAGLDALKTKPIADPLRLSQWYYLGAQGANTGCIEYGRSF